MHIKGRRGPRTESQRQIIPTANGIESLLKEPSPLNDDERKVRSME